MNKQVKRIAIEYVDGSVEVVYSLTGSKQNVTKEERKSVVTPMPNEVQAVEPPKHVINLKDLPSGNIAYVIKIDPEKESHRGGTYQRHTFRNAMNNDVYILDVTKFSNGVYKHLKEGDVYAGLGTLTMNGKTYINGKTKGLFIGKWELLKFNFVKHKKGFEI